MIFIWTSNYSRDSRVHVIDISTYKDMSIDVAELLLKIMCSWKGQIIACGDMVIRHRKPAPLQSLMNPYVVRTVLASIARGTRGRRAQLRPHREHLQMLLDNMREQCFDAWTGAQTDRTEYYNEAVVSAGEWFEKIYGYSPFSGPFPAPDKSP